MSTSQPRSWSLDERIDVLQHKGIIKRPFTSAERDLARNMAAAYYFYFYQGELPARALEQSSNDMSLNLSLFVGA